MGASENSQLSRLMFTTGSSGFIVNASWETRFRSVTHNLRKTRLRGFTNYFLNA